MRELSRSEYSEYSFLLNSKRLAFEEHFQCGFERNIGELADGKSNSLRHNGFCPFDFRLDPDMTDIKIGAILDSKFHLPTRNLLNYQSKYKRRSPKYKARCEALLHLKSKLQNIKSKLYIYEIWFDNNDVTSNKIREQIDETFRNIDIVLDIKALQAFEL